MNGKQAKKLRRAALGLATALDEAGRKITKTGYEVKKHTNNFSPSSIMSRPTVQEDGTEVQAKPEQRPSYQLLVRRDSLKGIYKALKTGRV